MKNSMRSAKLSLLFLALIAGCDEKPPQLLDDFSECMSKESLECAGVYQDAWVGEIATCKLTQPKANVPLIVQGTVPLLPENPRFKTEIQVLVNKEELAKKTLSPGDFEIRCVPKGASGVKQIELRFSNTQRLPNGDGRSVAARLRLLGFSNGKSK